jgi:hypothetical protein
VTKLGECCLCLGVRKLMGWVAKLPGKYASYVILRVHTTARAYNLVALQPSRLVDGNTKSRLEGSQNGLLY